jgi:ferredoxin-type protein NapF
MPSRNLNIHEALSRRHFLRGEFSKDTKTTAQIGSACLSLNKVECRVCEDVCPEAAIRFKPQLGGGYQIFVEAQTCTSCGECLTVCPVGAIVIAQNHESGSREDA